ATKRDSSSESQDLNRQLQEKSQEVKRVVEERDRLASVVQNLKEKTTAVRIFDLVHGFNLRGKLPGAKTTVNDTVSDQIAALQQDNLEKTLKIHKLERENQALRESGVPKATPSPSSSTSARTETQPPLPSMSNPRPQPSQATGPGFSPARPLNGDILRDLRSVGGLGRTLPRAPVQAELNRVRANYPEWRLPDFSAGLDGSKKRLKPWDKPRTSNYAMEEDRERDTYLDGESDQDTGYSEAFVKIPDEFSRNI
ncbi:hypothetical protein EV360DRAFT_91100, partial [Lentinula raphanica]